MIQNLDLVAVEVSKEIAHQAPYAMVYLILGLFFGFLSFKFMTHMVDKHYSNLKLLSERIENQGQVISKIHSTSNKTHTLLTDFLLKKTKVN